MATEKIENPNEYGADQIQILEGLEAVRKRPGMYIGSTSARGLHHLVYEIVDNAVDEALAGYCKNIEVTINPDNSITVEDDGRGIPVGMNHKAGKSALEVVYTVLHAGGKFGGGGYKVSGGLHGVGASVVNALSTKLCVEVYKEGQVYFQSYHIGKPDEPVKVIGTCDSEKHGTKVTFHPDPEIFEETVYDYDTLKQRLRETAFLTKGLRIVLTDTREESHHCHEFHYAGGIKEFVTYLNRSKEALYPDVIYCEGNRDGVYVEVAMQHNDSYNDATYSFVNNIITPEGGTHLAGFRNALTKTFNTYARADVVNNDLSINGKLKVVFIEDYRVSNAEWIFAAADVSEQISTASKEASGTGNMKFMLNGAPTLGTMDGANVEIVEEVGIENAFIFGLSSDEVINYENNGGYNPQEIYFNDWDIKRVVDQLMDGTYSHGDHEMFRDLYNSLLNTQGGDRPDRYFILKDFRSYAEAQKKVEEAYKDPDRWAKMALLNTASCGKFTSDRTIQEYVDNIWKLDYVTVKPEA